MQRASLSVSISRPANRGESPEFDLMIEDTNAQRIVADKAYASRANRELLAGKHRDGYESICRA